MLPELPALSLHDIGWGSWLDLSLGVGAAVVCAVALFGRYRRKAR
ncbi:MAG TPA: hypothetical protein VEA16_16470 [Vicinamibacterales bacterium]|nr:hypothetical protein [Vicinamibacterales bacterium]